MQTKIAYRLLFLLLLIAVQTCETDDILPTVELSAENVNLSEANGSVSIVVNLNAQATAPIVIPFTISGTATLGTDFSINASEIIIAEGSNSEMIILNGLQDNDVEGEETIIIKLENASEVLILSEAVITIALQDDDADSDNDGVLDANDECPDIAGDIANNGCPFLGFLINEVHYDPAADLPGDANNDGIRDANEDEFIEFFNSGPALDLSGYTVSDASQLRHTFPSGTVVPVNGVLVLFGGGNPTGDFGDAIVQTASEGLINMTNDGDFITIADPSGNVFLTFDIEPLSNNPNESYTRNPDLTGGFEQHAGIAEANGALFSPGTRLDGSSF